MKKTHSLSLLIICVVTTACGSSSSLDELKRLCEKDAGLKIYKTVEVDGYYDARGSNTIVAETDYQFIEYCNDNPLPIEPIPEPGCWRVSKVKRESGKCYEPMDKRLAKIVVAPYPEFLKDHCIAVEKIEKPNARYSFHSDPKQWLDKNGISKFFRTDVYVKDTATSEILGRFVSYSFDENPQFTPTISCKRLGEKFPSYSEVNLIQTVLKPTSKGVSHD